MSTRHKGHKTGPWFEYELTAFKNCDTSIKLDEYGIGKIRKIFKEQGYNVSSEAICSNYQSWLNNHKSDYLDQENGYSLITPDGREPLSFKAITI